MPKDRAADGPVHRQVVCLPSQAGERDYACVSTPVFLTTLKLTVGHDQANIVPDLPVLESFLRSTLDDALLLGARASRERLIGRG